MKHFLLFTFFIMLLLINIGGFSQSLEKNNNHSYFKLNSAIKADDYISKTIIIKINPRFRDVCSAKNINNDRLNKCFEKLSVASLQKKFPLKKAPTHQKNKLGYKSTDLSLIYELTYTADISIEQAINLIYGSTVIEYAEPHYIPKLLYIPNDPLIPSQYQLLRIKAFEAWDIEKGDTNIVIGITDTGTDFNHPDLVGSVKYNYYDPINGMDDDNDGFIDNYAGWDLGENDNNAQCHAIGHGAFVSGSAVATTDNGVGVAGPGFKCKFMPIKIDNSSGILTMAYEAIVYAADHSCDVINCSWGSVGASSKFGQDIINYATLDMGALVVAAAGNNNNTGKFYPASFEYVLSVAGTDINDHKWTDPSDVEHGSNYNNEVDVCAPSEATFSTLYGGGYSGGWGTSFASPTVAGAAALLKSYKPDYNGIQLGEQLKSTCDNIDTIPFNVQYAGKLGRGRINMFQSLTNFDSPAVLITDIIAKDNDDSVFVSGDNIIITANFTNYLAPTGNLSAILSSNSPNVSISNGLAALGVINTMSSKNNSSNPFKVRLLQNSGSNLTIDFTITVQDGNYSRQQKFSIEFNADYVNINKNKIQTSVTSNGRIGYTDIYANKGLGFIYDGSYSLLSSAGLLIGSSSTQISDCILSSFSAMENDFAPVVLAKRIMPPLVSDFDVEGCFTDQNAGINKLNVKVKWNAYAWNDSANQKYVILKYKIINNGTNNLNNLWVGLFADWDINEYDKNMASWDPDNKLGYVYSIFEKYYTGIALLSPGVANCYSIDNDGYYGSVSITDGFLASEKYTALKSLRPNAGSGATGNDVSQIISSGPFLIKPNDSTTVAFAILAGTHLVDLQKTVSAALKKYSPDTTHQGINNNEATSYLISMYPNPANTLIYYNMGLKEKSDISISIFDQYGKQVKYVFFSEIAGREKQFSVSVKDLPNGVYFSELIVAGQKTTQKLVIIK